MVQFTLFLTVAPIAAAVVIAVAGYSWLQGSSPLARTLTFYLLVVAGFLIANIAEFVAGSQQGAELFTRVQYLFWPFIPVLWLRLALLYVGQVKWAAPRRMWMFALLPAATTLLAWSNSLHGLIWDRHSFVQISEMYGYFHVERYGPWFWANGTYFYLLLLAGAVLMLLEAHRAPRIFLGQSLSMVTGALLPLGANLVYVFDLLPGLAIDYTPLSFAVAGLAFVVGILRHQLLALSPVGRAVLIESMRDPMMVLDEAQRVIDLNPAAQRFLSIAPADCLGKPFDQVWPAAANIAVLTPDTTRPLGWTSAQHLARLVPPIITWPERNKGHESQVLEPLLRSYELHISPLAAAGVKARGWLVVLHDITLRRQTEEALEEANKALTHLYREVAEKSEALSSSNEALTSANSALTAANTALQQMNEELEERVTARTESLRQRAAELEVVTRVSNALRHGTTHDELLNLLISETTAALGFGAGAVLLPEEDGLRVAAVYNLPAAMLHSLHPPHNDELWQALQTGSLVHLENCQVLPMLRYPSNGGFDRSMTGGVAAPMQSAGRSLGLLVFFFDAGHAPSQDWPLAAIAELGATALQRVRMLETLEQLVRDRTRDISTLYEVTTTTNEYHDLDTILAHILEKALEVLHGRIGLVHLLVEQDDPRYTLSDQPRQPQSALRLATTLGVERLPGLDPELPLAAGEAPMAAGSDQPGPWSVVFERGSILVVPDVLVQVEQPAPAEGQAPLAGREAPVATGEMPPPGGSLPVEIPVEIRHEFPPLPSAMLALLSQREALAYVGVPIVAKGRTLGVMSVFGQSLAIFSAEDIALLAAVADHVGGAVENAQLRQKAEQAAVVEERQRLARDLHDSVTQSLYSIVLFAEAGREALAPAILLENDEPPALDTSPSVARARQMLLRLAETSQQALKELRLLIYELRPLSLHKDGLVGALRSRLEMVEQRAGMRTVLQADQASHLAPEMESGLYGIAQEALNNVLKHAGASQVTVRLEGGPAYTELEISDNGCGFLVDPAWTGGGMGLSSMRERAAALGGALSVHSDVGRGTCILVTLTHPRQAFPRPEAEPEQQQEVPDDGAWPARSA